MRIVSSKKPNWLIGETIEYDDKSYKVVSIMEVAAESGSAWQINLTRLYRQLSCGCCTGGCVCFNHQDAPGGLPKRVCDYHKIHPHTHQSEID